MHRIFASPKPTMGKKIEEREEESEREGKNIPDENIKFERNRAKK